MITVEEIRRKSERKYDEVLQVSLKGDNCFPLTIRSNKTLSQNFVKMSKEIAEVISASKDRKGFGYSVISDTIKTRQHGIQDIPKSITFETLTDYLKFISKEKEFHRMLQSYNLIRSEFPQLNNWLVQNPRAIISNAGIWPDLLKVCKWFLHDFEPHKYYVRELPISVHTKFIEENKTILRTLLDEIIPDKINLLESDFERRYGLKYPQPLVRFRSLDKDCWENNRYDDLSLPLDQFAASPIKCRRVFIIENQMNFLTFPSVPQSIAIWSKGFAIECLKEVKWLASMEIYYWSDLDIQGFQMLSQLRSYFPQTESLLMEKEILNLYKDFIKEGTLSKLKSLVYLSDEESEVYEYLLKNNLRLEQERIPQSFITEKLNQIFKISKNELKRYNNSKSS